MTTTPTLSIRLATAADAAAVRRLALLDSARVPAGELLLGLIDDEPMAAVAIDTGVAVADPFHHTAEIVDLLRLRASRLRGEDPAAPSRRRWLRALLPA